MFKQIEEKYGDDGRIALMAIKTDGGGASGAESYLFGKADTSKWVIAADNGAKHYVATTGKDALFQYALIGPEGKVVDVGQAGSRYSNGPNKGKFVAGTDMIIKKVPA